MIWQAACHLYPTPDPRSLARRLRFGWRAWRQRAEWRALLAVPAHSHLGDVIRQRQGLMHLVALPYLHRDWNVRQRVETVVSHYRFVEPAPWLQVPSGTRQVLVRLDDWWADLSLQFDRPDWACTEGELVLSLFLRDHRIYSVAMAFGQRDGRAAVFIGGIQGKHAPGINDLYGLLTKQLHGCRPRDLVIQAALNVAEAAGVERLYGVSDGCRRQHHPSVRRRGDAPPSTDYDEIWRDRGGVPQDDGFWAFDTRFAPRDLASVASKKRAMYRRRHEMLAWVRDQMQALARDNRRSEALLTAPAL